MAARQLDHKLTSRRHPPPLASRLVGDDLRQLPQFVRREIAGLQSAVSVDGTVNDPRDVDRGWSVELALPWRVLGEQARRPVPPRDGDRWRVNFSRVQWPVDTSSGTYRKPKDAREDNWVWSPQHVVDMHRPEMWGFVQFSEQASGRPSFVPDASWPARAIAIDAVPVDPGAEGSKTSAVARE